jgi:uncharacterized membrane protein
MIKRICAVMLLVLFVPVFLYAQSPAPTVERVYEWFAEEKITVSNTVKQLSSEEYDYYYGTTKVTGAHVDANNAFVVDEIITDGTTAAVGLVKGYDSATSPTYLDIYVLYNGADSADIDPNDVLTGATNSAQFTVAADYTYSRGNIGPTMIISAQIAEVHVLDNSVIWTYNGATPVYSATDASCFGRKQYEGDTFYIFGSDAIKKFKAIRSSGTDAVLAIRYGR